MIAINTLCFGTFARILQQALQKPNSNQAVAQLLLDLITENAVNADIASYFIKPKKVSALFRYKENLHEDIVALSSDNRVINAITKSIKLRVVPCLITNQIADLVENLNKLIELDASIAQTKKCEFLTLASGGSLEDFLSETFLYAVNRQNIAASNKKNFESFPNKSQLTDGIKIQKGGLLDFPYSQRADDVPADNTECYIHEQDKRVVGGEHSSQTIDPKYESVNEFDSLIRSLDSPVNSKLLSKVIVDDKDENFVDFVTACFANYKNALVILHGEGGVGKTYQMLNCWYILQHETKYQPIFIPAKVLPVIGEHKNPILEYLCIQTDRIQDVTLSAYTNLCNKISSCGKEIVIVIDGINEYLVNTSTENGNFLLKEIELLQHSLKSTTRFILSSRSKDGIDVFDNVCAAEVSKLNKGQVSDYLSSLSLDVPTNIDLLKILELPLMLKLFVDITLAPMQIELMTITTASQLIERHIEWQLKKYKGDGLALAQYSLKVFLPLFTKYISGNLNDSNISGAAFKTVCNTISEGYFPILMRNVPDLDFVTRLKKRCDSPLTAYSNIVNNFLIKQALYLTKDNSGRLYWQHELFRDWFWAYGIAQQAILSKDAVIKDLWVITDALSGDKDQEDSTAADILPIAIFAYDFLKENNDINTDYEYLKLLSSISKAAYYIGDNRINKQFSELVMHGVDGYLETNLPTTGIADMLHFSSYLYLNTLDYSSLSNNEIEDELHFVKTHLEKSLSIITSESLICDNVEQRQLIQSKAYGNLGAYYLKLYSLSGSKNNDYLDLAYKHHKQAFELRVSVYEHNNAADDIYHLMGNGYNMLATDNFYYKNYKEAYMYHKKAIEFRSHPTVRNYRLIQSCSRGLGTLLKLYDSDSNMLEFIIKESLELLRLPISTVSRKRTLIQHKEEFTAHVKRCILLLKIIEDRLEVLKSEIGRSLYQIIIEYENLYKSHMYDDQELTNLIYVIKKKEDNQYE